MRYELEMVMLITYKESILTIKTATTLAKTFLILLDDRIYESIPSATNRERWVGVSAVVRPGQPSQPQLGTYRRVPESKSIIARVKSILQRL